MITPIPRTQLVDYTPPALPYPPTFNHDILVDDGVTDYPAVALELPAYHTYEFDRGVVCIRDPPTDPPCTLIVHQGARVVSMCPDRELAIRERDDLLRALKMATRQKSKERTQPAN